MTDCAHAWEDTGLTYTVSGTTWQHGKAVSYCPRCRQFAIRTAMYLDGTVSCTEAAAARANAAEHERIAAEKLAWLVEHHPDHAPTTL